MGLMQSIQYMVSLHLCEEEEVSEEGSYEEGSKKWMKQKENLYLNSSGFK